MKQKDVESVLGKPNKKFNDEDRNVIYLYYDKKLRLTFYADEDLKLGYIISSNPKITLLNSLIIGKDIDYLKSELPFKSWEIEDFDSVENHFNESNWLILQTEYNEVIRVEIGAIIKDNDEFDWKFK